MRKTKKNKMFNQKSKGILLLLGMALFFLAQSISVNAEQGTFYHKHTETCYETVEIPCTEHTTFVDAVMGTGFCKYCNKTTSVYAFHHILSCPYSGLSVEEYTIGVCQECGNILYETAHSSLPAHTREVTNLICGKTEETPIATVAFTRSTTETTTNPVIIAANVTVLDEEFDLGSVLYSFDEGATWVQNSSMGITTNGTYSVACKDASGTTFSETFVVDCIVKPQPTVKPAEPVVVSLEVPIIEPVIDSTIEETIITEEKETRDQQKYSEKSSEEKNKDIETILREVVKAEVVPIETGISMDGIRFMYFGKEQNSYLKNPLDIEISEVEIIERTSDETIAEEEIRVVYRLAPVFVQIIYSIGGLFLFVAILGCIWYYYHNIVLLYEAEKNERFFIGVLIGTGKKERKVYISEKKMEKIGTKEIVLTCFYRKKDKKIAIYTPYDKYRIPWEKEMKVNI